MTIKDHRRKSRRTRILLCDDHPIVREHLAGLISQQADLEVCASVKSAEEAIRAAASAKPDVAIIDLSLKETSGMELLKDLRDQYPDVQVLVLSMHDEALFAERVLRAGARGYITKQEGTARILLAIRRILAGNIYTSDKLSRYILNKAARGRPSAPSAVDDFTDRELEVFQLIGRGHSTRLIADELDVDVKTIETYRARIKEKLGVSTATELLQYAIGWVKSAGIL